MPLQNDTFPSKGMFVLNTAFVGRQLDFLSLPPCKKRYGKIRWPDMLGHRIFPCWCSSEFFRLFLKIWNFQIFQIFSDFFLKIWNFHFFWCFQFFFWKSDFFRFFQILFFFCSFVCFVSCFFGFLFSGSWWWFVEGSLCQFSHFSGCKLAFGSFYYIFALVLRFH